MKTSWLKAFLRRLIPSAKAENTPLPVQEVEPSFPKMEEFQKPSLLPSEDVHEKPALSPLEDFVPQGPYESRLKQFLLLWREYHEDEEKFDSLAKQQIGLTKYEIERIHSRLESATFRGIFGSSLDAHVTNFEDDPWFLAAQRIFTPMSTEQ